MGSLISFSSSAIDHFFCEKEGKRPPLAELLLLFLFVLRFFLKNTAGFVERLSCTWFLQHDLD
ncbi:Stress-response A/B barrel domain-containing protein [Psidium guajava]|nr:Stress-response A/B barrel domain-containing protein [Psidium guajava]